MEDLSAAIRGIQFIEHLGVEVLEISPGAARLALNSQPFMINSWGVLHGGVTMSLIDVCMSLAGRSLNPAGLIGVTIEMKVNFLAPGRDRLIAAARVWPQGRSMFCAECEVTMPDGTVTARGLGTFKLRNAKPAPADSNPPP